MRAIAAVLILVAVRNVPSAGRYFAGALAASRRLYAVAGPHGRLTLESFAYLRLPLAMAAVAFLIGALGSLRAVGQRAFLAAALMMVLFFHAARLAMVTFDPYLSSRPLAEALLRSPQGELVVDHHYYTFSSIFFYTNRTAWLLNGRFNNLVYGSYAPGAPDVFLDRCAVEKPVARPAAVLPGRQDCASCRGLKSWWRRVRYSWWRRAAERWC